MNHRYLELAASTQRACLCITLFMLIAAFSAVRVHAAEPAQALPPSGYTVLRGDTLDRVIQKTMAGSPLKIEILRQAFADLNPQAFVNGKVARLKAGAVLQVPDHVQLLRATIMPVLGMTDISAASAEAQSSNTNASERRGWVRFP
jgi:Tfp pilus assembly protein FimV